MSNLPPELDFLSSDGRIASPERMDRMAKHIASRLRALEATRDAYDLAIKQLQDIGLQRLNEVLLPLFEQSQTIADQLAAIHAQWADEELILADYYSKAQSDAAFAAIDHSHALAEIAGLVDALALKATAASPTLTGSIYSNGSQRGNVAAVAAVDLDCSTANYFTKTVAATTAFTLSNVPDGSYGLVLEVTHTAGVISFPASVKPVKGQFPTLTTGKTHLFGLTTRNGGATWRLAVLPDFVT